MKEKILKIILVILIILLFVVTFIVYKYKNIEKENINIVDNNILQKQVLTDNMIEKYKNDKTITIDNPKVINNPYYLSPLTSVIIFYTETLEEIVLKINDGEEIKFSSSNKHVIPIYGLYPDYNNKIIISTKNFSKEIYIKTDKVDISNIEIEVNDEEINEKFLVTTTTYPIIYNSYGEVIWYLTENFSEDIVFLENGHIILSTSQLLSDNFTKTGFVEIDLFGKIYNEYILNGGYHDQMLLLNNGNYLVLSSNVNDISDKGILVEIDKSNGKVVKKIILKDIFSSIDYTSSLFDIETFTYNNGKVIMYLKNVNALITIDYNTQKIISIYSDNEIFNIPIYQEYLTNVNFNNISTVKFLNDNLNIFYNSINETNYDCNNLQIDNASIIKYDESMQEKSKINLNILNIGNTDIEKTNSNNLIVLSSNNFNDKSNICEVNHNFYGKIYMYNVNELIFSGELEYDTNSISTLKLYENRMNVNTQKYNIFSTDFEISKINTDEINDFLKNADKIDVSYTIDNIYFNLNLLESINSEVEVLFISKGKQSYKINIKEKGEQIKSNFNISGISGTFDLYIKINNTYYELDKNIQLNNN